MKKCTECKEVLLDEFSFYTTFNDLDKDLDFNYQKNLNKFMNSVESKIKLHDYRLMKKYIFISIAICIVFVVLLVIALRITYR